MKRAGTQLLKLLERAVERLSPDYPEHSADIRRFIFSLTLSEICFRSEGFHKEAFHDAPADSLRLKIATRFRNLDQFYKTSIFTQAVPQELPMTNADLARLIVEIQSDPASLNLETGMFLFESFLKASHTNKEGVVHTPPKMAERMVERSLEALSDNTLVANLKTLRVIDPACGSGIFLVQMVRALLNRLSTARVTLRTKQNLITQCLHGVDRDPLAVEMTKLSLNLFLQSDPQQDLFNTAEPICLDKNIRLGNSLLSHQEIASVSPLIPIDSRELLPFTWEKEFSEVMSDGGFDCVIGNPPYGLSRDEQISLEENQILQRVYDSYRSGKVNKYMLFMARGLELLREGGVLSYIVPNSWLGIRSGRALREQLLRDGAIHALEVFESPVFEGLSVETVAFTIRKGKSAPKIAVRRWHSAYARLPRRSALVSSKLCLKHPECAIPSMWSRGANDVFSHLDRTSVPLRDDGCFTPYIAIQAYAVGKGLPPQTREMVANHVFHANEKKDDLHYPYLEGADVERYAIQWSGSFLKHGPWLAEPQPLERFSGPRVIVREILSSTPYLLQAAYSDETMLYNKSVLHIRPAQNVPARECLALLGILNSKLASYVIYLRGRKSQRSIFPKIVLADLADFPLPRRWNERIEGLVSLVTRRLENSKSEEIDCAIDQAVFELYALKNSHVQEIQSFLLSYNKKNPRNNKDSRTKPPPKVPLVEENLAAKN